MLAYQIKLALKSLRRNPALSALMICGIGLGIAVSSAFITTYYLMAGDPIPEKSDQLLYVEIDAWDPDDSFDEDHPDRPPNQISYRDMRGIMESDIPTYQSAMFKSSLTVQPDGEDDKPYRASSRLCFSGFFPMFEVPFEFGGPWGPSVDENLDQVVVLNAETNRRLFGGEDSVGRRVRINNQEFTVVGVIGDWRPDVKFYDLNNNPFGEPEEIFIPFNLLESMEIASTGNDSNWKTYDGDTYQDFLESESVWIQMWVQLDSRRQKEHYLAFLDAYAQEQKRLGRHGRPVNNVLLSVTEYMETEEVVQDEAKMLLIISILFLIVCSVNLIGILLGKFLGRAPEVGVRRALGASRLSVFLQHIVECEVVGLLGGVLGLGLSWVALELINRLFDNRLAFHLDLTMVFAAFVLSLFAGLIAGLYPAWRICRVAPATYLKLQ
jgi:putative ABC transport system permease protein